jgi:hypothetical protein
MGFFQCGYFGSGKDSNSTISAHLPDHPALSGTVMICNPDQVQILFTGFGQDYIGTHLQVATWG